MSLPKFTWPTTTVGSLCDQIRGVSYSKGDARNEPDNSLVPILRANNIHNDGMLAFDDLIYVPRSVVAATQYIREHDIVIAASSGSLSVVGKAAQARSDWSGGFGAFCKVLRPNTKVEPRYLAYFFRTEHYRHRISQLAAGANINNLRNEHLDDLEIPLPPLSEQKRIADILDKADGIRRKRQEAIDEFDKLLRSTFAQMFGDPNRNSMGWEVARLGDVATLDRGRSRHRPRDAKFLYGGPYPLVQTGDITNSNGFVRVHSQSYSEEGLAQSRLWPAGTLCITIAANIGKTAVLAFDACFPDSVVGLIVGSRLTTEYVRHWFVAVEKATDAAATQVAQKNINLEYLRNLAIQIPPIAKQQQFSAFLNAMRQTQEKAEIAMLSTDNLFNSLVQRAFKGEL